MDMKGNAVLVQQRKVRSGVTVLKTDKPGLCTKARPGDVPQFFPGIKHSSSETPFDVGDRLHAQECKVNTEVE